MLNEITTNNIIFNTLIEQKDGIYSNIRYTIKLKLMTKHII
jgi:hypothetical protein